MAYAKFVVITDEGLIEKLKAWIVLTNVGPKVICQGLYKCEKCRAKSEEKRSFDGRLACMLCDFKCVCHQEMEAHVQFSNHHYYF